MFRALECLAFPKTVLACEEWCACIAIGAYKKGWKTTDGDFWNFWKPNQLSSFFTDAEGLIDLILV